MRYPVADEFAIAFGRRALRAPAQPRRQPVDLGGGAGGGRGGRPRRRRRRGPRLRWRPRASSARRRSACAAGPARPPVDRPGRAADGLLPRRARAASSAGPRRWPRRARRWPPTAAGPRSCCTGWPARARPPARSSSPTATRTLRRRRLLAGADPRGGVGHRPRRLREPPGHPARRLRLHDGQPHRRQRERLEAFLPRLRAAHGRHSGVLLVLDNLETLLTPDGDWRDAPLGDR